MRICSFFETKKFKPSICTWEVSLKSSAKEIQASDVFQFVIGKSSWKLGSCKLQSTKEVCWQNTVPFLDFLLKGQKSVTRNYYFRTIREVLPKIMNQNIE